MRFCFVTTFYPPFHFGGDALVVYWLANALAERGHHVEVVHCQDAYRALSGEPATGRFDNHPDLVLHTLASAAGGVDALLTHQLGRPVVHARALREILSRPFDVIHYHNASLVGGPAVLALGDAIKLYTMHEYWLVCPTHDLLRFGSPCDRPRHCGLCSLAHGRPPQWWRASGLLERAAEHIDLFLSPSRFGIEEHRRLGFPGAMRLLPNFAPPALETGPAVPPAPDDGYFLYVGRLERPKGIRELVDFFARWECGRLKIAGAGSDASAVARRAAGCERIEYLGALPRESLAALYAGATAVVVPSLHAEQFPLVILEALQAGVPVVGHDAGPIRELLEEAGAGLVYRDDAELHCCLASLGSDPPLRAALAERGIAAVRERWSLEAHLRRYFSLIEEAAGRCAA